MGHARRQASVAYQRRVDQEQVGIAGMQLLHARRGGLQRLQAQRGQALGQGVAGARIAGAGQRHPPAQLGQRHARAFHRQFQFQAGQPAFALDPRQQQFAAHQPDQVVADRQAQRQAAGTRGVIAARSAGGGHRQRGTAIAGVGYRQAQALDVAGIGQHFGLQLHLAAAAGAHCAGQQVGQYLAQAPGVAAVGRGQAAVGAGMQAQALLGGGRGGRGDHVVQQVAQVERALVQLQLAGLQAGEIEDVAHDLQQAFHRFLEHAQHVHLLLVERGVREQFDDAQGAGDRRADLVADQRQEGAGGMGGGLGGAACLVQVGDVGQGAQQRADAVAAAHRVQAQAQLARRVGAAVVDLAGDRLAGLVQAALGLHQHLRVLAVHLPRGGQGAAEHVLAPAVVVGFEGLVHGQVATVAILEESHAGHGLQQRGRVRQSRQALALAAPGQPAEGRQHAGKQAGEDAAKGEDGGIAGRRCRQHRAGHQGGAGEGQAAAAGKRRPGPRARTGRHRGCPGGVGVSGRGRPGQWGRGTARRTAGTVAPDGLAQLRATAPFPHGAGMSRAPRIRDHQTNPKLDRPPGGQSTLPARAHP